MPLFCRKSALKQTFTRDLKKTASTKVLCAKNCAEDKSPFPFDDITFDPTLSDEMSRVSRASESRDSRPDPSGHFSFSRQASVAANMADKLDSRLRARNMKMMKHIKDEENSVESGNTSDVTVESFSVDTVVSDAPFTSKFQPEDMRLLALVAHNHMKKAMKEFVLSHKNVLSKFRLTGTGTTMRMLTEVFGAEHMKKYGGPVCKSGPLGGDAELVALIATGNIGAVLFFQDPMDAHPHYADIETLNRQANVWNVVMCPNTSSAHAFSVAMRMSLEMGEASILPSFFETLESPSVAAYKSRQEAVLAKSIGA